MNRRRSIDEALEASLKGSLTVNPISKQQNLRQSISSQDAGSKGNSRKPKTANPKLLKTSQSFNSRARNQVQFPVKNLLFGVEQNHGVKTSNTVKRKSSTLDFVEKLKQIDKKVEKSTFLEQANEEIDVAAKQLQELRKMISEKFKKEEELKEQEELQRQKKAMLENCNKQFERMQKSYLNKTKQRFKSLQDVENMTLARQGAESPKQKEDKRKHVSVEVLYPKLPQNMILPSTSSENFDLGDFNRNEDLHKAGLLLKKQITSVASKTDVLAKPKTGKNEATQADNYRLVTQKKEETKPKVSQRVRFRESKPGDSILKAAYFSPSASGLLSPSPQSEESDDGDVKYIAHEENKFQMKNESIQALTNFRRIDRGRKVQKVDEASSTSERLQSGTKAEQYQEGRRKLNLLLHGKEKLNGVQFDDAKLEESVLKSAYLTKEFCNSGNESIKVQGKGVGLQNKQLLEGFMYKLRENQSCQLASVKKRDRRLNAVLDIALKDTLYTRIQK